MWGEPSDTHSRRDSAPTRQRLADDAACCRGGPQGVRVGSKQAGRETCLLALMDGWEQDIESGRVLSRITG